MLTFNLLPLKCQKGDNESGVLLKKKESKNDGTRDSLSDYLKFLPSSAALGVIQLSLTLTHGNSHLCLL